jgi:hypothetical protein
MMEFSIDNMWRHDDGFFVAECTSYRTQEKFIAVDRWGSWMAVRPPFDRKLVDKIGLWEGHNFFTMELIFKRLLMSPGEKKNFTIYYVPGTGDLQTAIRSLKEFKPASGK